MKKLITLSSALVARLLMVVGFAGIPDDLQMWSTWLSQTWERLSMFDLFIADWLMIAWFGLSVFVVFTWDYWAEKRIPWFDERIPFIKIRDLAIKRKVMVGEHNADANPAYEIEKELTQLAATGEAKIWGRRVETPLGSSPLLEIPADHFRPPHRFDIAHGNLHYRVQNKQSHTGKLGASIYDFNGCNYCDLHLMKSDALRAIRAIKKAAKSQSRLPENKQA